MLKLGVTHSTKCFHPPTGLHLPLWFVHQWQGGAVVHMSCRCMRVVQEAAQRGIANGSPDGTQYCSAAHAEQAPL